MKYGFLLRATKNVTKVVAKKSPTILTALAVGGTIATAVMAVKGDRKAKDMKEAHEMDSELLVEGQAIFDENGVTEQTPCRFRERTTWETAKLTWKCYIPAGLMGMATISCIIGANTINVKRNIALATAYSLSEEAAKEFRDKVSETIGEKKTKKIEDQIVQDKVTNTQLPEDENMIYTGHGEQLMFDAWSGRYFKSSRIAVERAVLGLNKELAISKDSRSVNDYYEAIGLPYLHNDCGDSFGWNYTMRTDGEDITVDFQPVFSPKQEPCVAIVIKPELLYTYGDR